MAMQSGRFRTSRRVLWHRARFQLGMGLLLAVLLPWVIRVCFAIEELEWPGLQNSVIGSTIALTAGYFGFRRLSRYPGVRASHPIFPSYAVSYGTMLALFFFARLDYSRLHFSASFLICIAWYYVVYFKLQRQRLRIGVVPSGNTRSLTTLGEISWLDLSEEGAAAQDVDVIVADLHSDLGDDWERFLADRALGGTLVMHVKQMEESLTGRVAIEHLSENTLGSLIPGLVYGKVKRAGDLIFAATALPVLAPLFLVVATAIRLDTSGPAFFLQQRMGYRGSPFRMIKFRTMAAEASSEMDPRMAAITGADDHRVTRVGRFLRRYRLDELPQIVNILRGEMSWIGPRPEALALSAWYEAELPFYRYRHIVPPGITGWAQVRQGHVSEVDDVLGKLHYDFYYIKNFSFWLDLLIVAGTLKTIVTGHGVR